jgi:hypothetical protein
MNERGCTEGDSIEDTCTKDTRAVWRSGAEEDRTPNLGIANAALSQLSYRPSSDFRS